jgi:DnaJ like chaperone protein
MFAADLGLVWPRFEIARVLMTIWGKILGSAAGFALGGPIGALVGGIAGHAVDVMREEGAQSAVPDATRQIAFTIAVIALGAKMAKADGAVTRPEVDAFRQVFHVPEDEVRNVAFVFDRAKQDVNGFEAYASQVAKLFRDQPNVLEDLLDGLFHIAKADGEVHAAELRFLAEVARIFGFDEAAFARIREAHIGPDVADPHAILGVAHDVDDATLKATWRRLAREHHPDALIAQGMPPEFVAIANERLARINDAYDRIVKSRATVG